MGNADFEMSVGMPAPSSPRPAFSLGGLSAMGMLSDLQASDFAAGGNATNSKGGAPP